MSQIKRKSHSVLALQTEVDPIKVFCMIIMTLYSSIKYDNGSIKKQHTTADTATRVRKKKMPKPGIEPGTFRSSV